MLTNHFYHEIIRKTIVSFGTLFNNIEIQHKDGSGKTVSVIKVPISYGPMQKFLARITQGREYQDGVGTTLTLPRICLLYTSPSPRDVEESRMPSSA